MSAPVPPPGQPVRPPVCGNGKCGSAGVMPHCANPRCPWSLCTLCCHLTGFVLGQVRAITTTAAHAARTRAADVATSTAAAAENAAAQAAARLTERRKREA